MSDIEMLPLPEADDSVENHAQWPIVSDSDVWLQRSVQDYARAVAEHNVSRALAESDHSLRTENAGLALALEQAEANVKARDAEIEALRDLCGAAYQLAGVHDAPEVWLDALSAAASGHPFSTDGLLPYMPQAVCEAEARAERLAEALRWYVENDDTNEGQEGNEYWLAGRDRAIAVLRDYDRERKDG